MKRGNIILLFLLILFIFSNAFSVSAVGITGVRLVDKIDFEPFLERTFNYRIGTNADHGMNYTIHVRGALAPYFSLSASSVYLEPSEGYEFTATMRLPESLEPGLHTAGICVLETEAGEGAGNIGVVTEVCATVEVRVLYPGKYLVIRSFHISVANKQVTFSIGVENWGTDTIDSLQSIIDIYDLNETSKIITVESDKQSLESNKGTTIISYLNAEGISVGDYFAKATVLYDGYDGKINQTFKLGELDLHIINLTREFEINKINPFEIEVESIWNRMIRDVYANINISKEGATTQIIKTSPTDIDPWGRAKLLGYFDTNNIVAGEYDAQINIIYSGKSTETHERVTVKEPTRFPISVSTNTVLLLAILILLAVLILLVLRRKRKQ